MCGALFSARSLIHEPKQARLTHEYNSFVNP